MSNQNLRKAKQQPNDEFFTLYKDIEQELVYYKDYLRDKIVYCNCDSAESNFVKFLNDVKDEWQIKDIWHTSLDEGFSYDGDYAKELLYKCDVVITNPPFSKVRAEFVPLLIESGKQFLFIGNLNMATYKEVFPLIKEGKMWCGYSHPKTFTQPNGAEKKFGNIVWWTNLPVQKKLNLDPNVKYYGNEDKYPRYDNYDAINIDRIKDIPSDYKGCMGVPITFIESYTPPHPNLTSSDSEKETTAKTSELTPNTSICVTLSDCRNDLWGQTILQKITHSDLSVMNMMPPAKISNNLSAAGKAYTREFLLLGLDEACGSGLSHGLRQEGTADHVLIRGKRKLTRLFIRRIYNKGEQ